MKPHDLIHLPMLAPMQPITVIVGLVSVDMNYVGLAIDPIVPTVTTWVVSLVSSGYVDGAVVKAVDSCMDLRKVCWMAFQKST